MKEVGYEKVHRYQIYSDNQSAITLVKNLIFHHRIKHIEIQAHFIREKVMNDLLHLKYFPLVLNYTDFFTKPLLEAQFYMFRDSIRLVKFPSIMK